jgi:hypothetical protein
MPEKENSRTVKKRSEINDFKDLIIWIKGMDIAEKCDFLTITNQGQC